MINLAHFKNHVTEMMILLRFTYWCLLLFATNAVSYAQSGMDTLLLNYKKSDTREKMYVHFDKSIYNPGETIWFKAYLSTGVSRSEVSTNFYAELYADSGRLMHKITAPVLFSGAHSHFEIPENYTGQRLVFRAYTVAMLNSDTNFLYSKVLTIANPGGRIANTKAHEPILSVLPEGGDMVVGVHGNIAFKAALPDGTPVEVTGSIKDPDGKKVISFASVHNGMGTFKLLPATDRAYSVRWKDEAGKEHQQPLPPAKTSGVSLQVTDKMSDLSGTSIGKTFRITRPDDAPDQLKRLNLVAIMDGRVMFEATINLTAKTIASATLPTEELGTGILQLTIFDNNWFPVAERICFVNNQNFEFDADAWMAELNTEKRKLNVAEVKISDTIPANLSLSITDADLDMPLPMADNIVTSTLLTGELRGKVYKPYYYFYSTSDSVALHLDLVMLTNGWRRYNWNKVFAPDSTPPLYTDNRFLSIEGNLIGASSMYKNGLELAGFLKTANSEATNLIVLPVERSGKVSQQNLFFYDTATLMLNYNDKNRVFDPSSFSVSNGLLQINQSTGLSAAMAGHPYLPDSSVLLNNMRYNKEYLQVLAKKFENAHELENVIVTAKAKSNVQLMDERYASGLFSGGNATMFDVANDPMGASSISLFQYLQGRVAGLQISGMGPNATLSWRGGAPGIYMDEMETDVSMAGSINMADVAYVKVFNPGSSFGFRNGANGVIAVYTKRGNDAGRDIDSKMGSVRLNGYTAIKEFYAIDYSTPSPDEYYDNLNVTLYWDPMILLGDNQKRKTIKFYNNDITKRFRIVLEGIDQEGRLLHVEKVISNE